MARPRKKRTLESLPAPVIYIPAGWTKDQVSPVEVAIEDFEVMRLADGRGYSIEEAGAKVGVSRSTAGRMLERARRAIALAMERRAPIYLDASEALVLEPPSAQEMVVRAPSGRDYIGCLAIACLNADVEMPVERIFGRAPAFAIISADGQVQGLVDNPGAGVTRNAAKIVTELLEVHGVGRVVAGRFGPDAISVLAGSSIQPLVANGFSLRQAIEFFIQKNHDANNRK